MEESVEKISSDVSLIKSAIIGNEFTNDKGIVGQISTLEIEIDHLKKDLDAVQKEAIANKQIIIQLKFVTGVAVAMIIGMAIKNIFI